MMAFGMFTEIHNIGTDADDSRTFGTAIGDLNNDGFYDLATYQRVYK